MLASRRKTSEAVRCRYCVEEQSFLPMIPELNGRFVCQRCAHVEQPEDPDFPCTCRKCIKEFLFSYSHRPRIRRAG